MLRVQAFYYACPNCGDEEHEVILPRSSPLGEYARFKTPQGVNEYGAAYRKSPKEWPATFACFHCRVCFTQDEDPKCKSVDSDRICRTLKDKTLWRIEIASEDPKHYAEEAIYTMTRDVSPKERAPLARLTISCSYPGIALDRVRVSAHQYDFG